MGRAFEFRKTRKLKRWAQMSKAFTRIGKDIVIAVKEGGADPQTNSKLRQVMQNAKNANMPKENVLRAIKKASDKDTKNYEEITLEGYAPHGIAVFIDCATDNNNRTVADIRSYFNKCNGSLGKNGSLEFIFERKGVFILNSQKLEISLDDLEMDLIDYGLENLHVEQNEVLIYCAFSDFNILSNRLEMLNVEILKTEIQRIPKATKTISLDQAKDVFKLLDLLEENDDVQQVAHDITMTKEILTI
tara:strand:- start:195 stop:932 length:738 start_codon:yes stop_codon:yes gene_type:complete